MLEFMPGSPFNDEKLTADQVQLLNTKYGLDKPIVVRFFNYVKRIPIAVMGTLFHSLIPTVAPSLS